MVGGGAGMAIGRIVYEDPSPATVARSIVGPNCRVNSYALVEDSILFEGVNVGRHAKVRRAIIDKGVSIPANGRFHF